MGRGYRRWGCRRCRVAGWLCTSCIVRGRRSIAAFTKAFGTLDHSDVTASTTFLLTSSCREHAYLLMPHKPGLRGTIQINAKL